MKYKIPITMTQGKESSVIKVRNRRRSAEKPIRKGGDGERQGPAGV
ncbi:MAG: hypothetical protein H7321_01485 [Bacteroidia bacterium]|nr:hypothetical protein [Bacteroidia bacterium]